MSSDLDTLLEMGFSRNRSLRALSSTKHQGLPAAIDWINEHENDADIDDEFIEPAGHSLTSTGDSNNEAGGSNNESETLQARSLKCDECGKLFKSPEAAQTHGERTGHSNFSESTEEIKPLTEQERQTQLLKAQEILKQKRLEKEEKEKQEQIEREKQRRVHGKEMIQIKQKMQEDEMKKILEERRREKEAEKQAKQRIRDLIEKDKLDRAAKFGPVAPPGECNKTTSAEAPPGECDKTSETPPARAAPREYTETNLQVRLFNGETIVHKFNVNETLAAVRLFVHSQQTSGQMNGDFTSLSFSTSFPRKVFTEDDMMTPLKQLGLVPSATLILTKTVS